MSTTKKILLVSALVGLMVNASAGAAKADCSLTSVGFTPLNDLGAGQYLGYAGGLYPNSTNTRPTGHLLSGLDIAQNQIQPLDSSGNPDPLNGKIVLLSIGMSNATAEFGNSNSNAFKSRADIDPTKNSQLTIVDGAQSGETAKYWIDYITDPYATWATAKNRITTAGATPGQVQIVWLKEADAYRTTDWGPFPTHAQGLQSRLAEIVKGVKFNFPNAKITYVSSRTRAYTLGGTLAENLNPEPKAFESGFANKWLIEQQISGDTSLNFDPAKGAVVAPWLSWGPYLWTDGLTPRSDGLTWLCTDVAQNDFTHPSSNGGVPKVADQLLAFFKSDPTATPWFLKKAVTGQPPTCASTATPSQGVAPLTVNFASAASDSDGTITQYAWTFDDGSFSLQPNPTKIFPVPGLYNVYFTASDNDGNTATCTVPVTANVSPSPQPSPTPIPTPTPITSPTPTPAPTPITIMLQVNSSSDDANQDGNTYKDTQPAIFIGTRATPTMSYFGARFNNISIPRGSVINSAQLQVYSQKTAAAAIQTSIAGENIGNSPTFSSTNKLSNRTLTSAQISFSPTTSWTVNTWYYLPEMAGVIQEIVNRSDWNSGNSLSIIVKGSGIANINRFLYAFDSSPASAPKLAITYTPL